MKTEASRIKDGARTKKPKPPTKLPKGPSEGSLSPADKATPTKTKMTQAEQSAEFERVAREHGAEGDEESFERVLRKLTRRKAPQSDQSR